MRVYGSGRLPTSVIPYTIRICIHSIHPENHTCQLNWARPFGLNKMWTHYNEVLMRWKRNVIEKLSIFSYSLGVGWIFPSKSNQNRRNQCHRVHCMTCKPAEVASMCQTIQNDYSMEETLRARFPLFSSGCSLRLDCVQNGSMWTMERKCRKIWLADQCQEERNVFWSTTNLNTNQ